MAQEESQSERTEKSSQSKLNLTEVAATKRVDEFVDVQTELFNKFQETNQRWLERMQSKSNLASEFASKLTAARSMPAAMTACQEWTSRWFEMMAEDGKQLLADSQKFMETGSRPMFNGSSRPGVST